MKEEMIENLKNQVQSLLKQQVEASDKMSFSSVQELQEKNMELMRQLQVMEQEKKKEEEEEKQSNHLQELEKEIDDLKKQREEQQVLMNTLIKQRDMYRVLLAEKDQDILHQGQQNPVEVTATQLKKQVQELTNELMNEREDKENQVNELEEENKQYELEIIRLKKSLQSEQQNHALAKETVNQLERSTSTLEMKWKKSENDLLILQQSVLTKEKENETKQEQINSLQGSNISLQQQVSQLSSSLEALRETRDQWQEERKKLRCVIDEVQQSSSTIQLQYQANLQTKQSEVEKLEKQCKEMESELNELRAVQISRLNEVLNE